MMRAARERTNLYVVISILGYAGLAGLTWMFPGKTSPEWLSYFGVLPLLTVLGRPLAYGAFLVLLAPIWIGYWGLVFRHMRFDGHAAPSPISSLPGGKGESGGRASASPDTSGLAEAPKGVGPLLSRMAGEKGAQGVERVERQQRWTALGQPRVCRQRSTAAWPIIGVLAVPALAVVAAAPALSADMLLHLSYGRMIVEWGANPYIVAPRVFITDPIIALNQTWADLLTPYGPLWVTVCAAVAGVAGHSPLVAIALFRLISLAAHLVGAALAGRIADSWGRADGDWVFALVALNPLLIIESAYNGHSDGVMAMLFLLGLWLDAHGRRSFSWVAMAASGLVKFSTLPALALFAVYAWRRSGWQQLVKGMAIVVLVAGLLLAPYWVGPATVLGPLAENTRYDTLSVPFIVHSGLGRMVSEPRATVLTSVATLLPAVLLLLLFAVRQKGDMIQLIRQAALVTMVWVLVATAHLRQWYFVPAVVLAGTLAPHPVSRLALAFAVGVSVYYASPALAAYPLARLLFALACLVIPAIWLVQIVVRELREG